MNERSVLNIVYTTDDSYLPLVGVSIASVVKNNQNKCIHFYIATELNENTANYIKLKEFYSNNLIKFSFIDTKSIDKELVKCNLNKWGSNSFYVYWRLFVFEILNVDYAIYLDSDVLCLNEINNIALDNFPVGCVIDSVHSCYNKLMNKDFDFKFYNTGVMFVDVNSWKTNKCSEKCLNYLKTNNTRYMMADQDIFSLALQDEIKTISPKYNWFAGYDYYGLDKTFDIYSLKNKTFYTKDELINSSKDIVLYHCLDGVFGRPWQVNNFHPKKDLFLIYRNLSPWNDYLSNKNISLSFKIQKMLETILPTSIYVKLHNYAIKKSINNFCKTNNN